VAYQLVAKNRAWLPTMPEKAAVTVPITTVGKIGSIGPYHMDVKGNTAEGEVRGPFSVAKIKAGSTPTYPILWSHDAKRERTVCFEAESEGQPLKGKTKSKNEEIGEKVQKVWATASHLHLNRDFRFNSQSTAMQYAKQKTIGGRAWISIQLPKSAQEQAMALWGNTTLGILLYWWHANRQQSGRGSIGKAALDGMPVLDVTKLTAVQLNAAEALFKKLSAKELLTVDELGKDSARAELDAEFATKVLGMNPSVVAPGGPLELLRMKLGQEPSITG